MVRPKGFQTFLGNKNGDLKINEEKKKWENSFYLFIISEIFYNINYNDNV